MVLVHDLLTPRQGYCDRRVREEQNCLVHGVGETKQERSEKQPDIGHKAMPP